MIALAIISGANLIPHGAACERDLGHAACRHVRACRLIKHDPEMVFSHDKRDALPGIMLSFDGSDGSSIKTRLASMRCMGGCGVLNMRPPSDSKSPRPVSRRGLDYCDDDNMPVICPTRQDLFARAFRNCFLRELSQSVAKTDRHWLQKSPPPIYRRGLIIATMTICR
jgi:hypothetical protein